MYGAFLDMDPDVLDRFSRVHGVRLISDKFVRLKARKLLITT